MTSEEFEPLDILIVEDDSDARANLTDILELDGHGCRSASTLSEARSAIAEAVPSAVILDRKLPDGHAESCIPGILKDHPDLPIVVVTGYPDIESAIHALRLGAYDYLLKPINPEALRHSLRRIAERHRYVSMLRHQRDFAESVIQTAQAIVLVLDSSGQIVSYNTFMEELSGVPLAEVKGQDWFTTFLFPEDRRRAKETFEQAFSNRLIRDEVHNIKTRRGSPAIISWSSTRLHDPQDRGSGILLIGHDITELRKAQQRIVQNERLAAIGEMVTGLAHESRNAFQRSQACLEMLALDLENQAGSLALVDKIQNALDHLKFLYEEVRSYAAPINLRQETVDLRHLLQETWSHLEPSRRDKKISFHLVAEPTISTEITADQHQLQQVFRNLLENALDACGAQGDIRACLPLAPDKANEVIVEISDSGPGISGEVKHQIFEPFFTTKNRGTGLGMAISKRIVEAHGGTIEAGDAVADGALAGAVLRVTLPRKSGKS